MVEDEDRAECVRLLIHCEDLVFRITRVDDVRGVHGHGLRLDLARRAAAAGPRRRERLRHPVEQRERHVQVLGEHDIR